MNKGKSSQALGSGPDNRKAPDAEQGVVLTGQRQGKKGYSIEPLISTASNKLKKQLQNLKRKKK